MEQQPAKVNYFFDQGFQDLKDTITDFWKNNEESANKNFQKARQYTLFSIEFFKVIFYGVAGISVYVFGSVWFLALSLLHISILSIVYLIVYFLFSFTWLLDYLFRVKEGIFSVCPNPGCYKKSQLPIYRCRKCGARHTQLWPSKYGIWTRTCTGTPEMQKNGERCGEKIPCTFFNKRGDLPAICPHCEQNMKSEEGTPLVIPIFGPRHAGKTMYLYSLLAHIFGKFEENGYEVRTKSKALIDDAINRLATKGSLGGTDNIEQEAIDITLSKNSIKYTLYFYDAAGEMFKKIQHLESHRFYDYFSALLFVMDPIAIEQVRNEFYEPVNNYLKNLSPQDKAAYDESKSLENVYTNLMVNLAKNYHIKDDTIIKQSLAVIIPKMDLLTDKIPETDKECRSFLTKYGQSGFIKQITWKFKNVQFFGVVSNYKNPINILAPIEWIIKKDMKQKAFRRFFGNLLMTFFVAVVVGGLLLGGTLAYNAISNYDINRQFSKDARIITSETKNESDYRVAAEKGDADAQFKLGEYYYFNTDAPKDYEEAVSWIQKAAKQGHADAQGMLGVCYEIGSGVNLDYKQAVFWYLKAAEQGNANAQYNLGRCYDNGYGVTQDYTQAVSWLQKATKQGSTVAEYNMQGICCENGLGVEKDENMALFWFEEMLTKEEKSLSEKDKNALRKRIKVLRDKGYSSSRAKMVGPVKMSGRSTFQLQGNVEKVKYDDGRYLYFNAVGNVLKQNVRAYVRGRMVGEVTNEVYEYVYNSPTSFVIKQFTSYPNNEPIPLKIVCEENARQEVTNEGLGWIFTYDTENRLTQINEPEYGFGCTTTYTYEANNTYPSKKDVLYYYDDGGSTKENFIFSGYVFDDHGNWTKRSVKYQIINETQDDKTETKTNEYYENRSVSYF